MSVKAYLGLVPYPFLLDVPGLSELESETGYGLWHLQARFESRTCLTHEVQLAFNLGLRGAGLPEAEALRLTAEHVVPGRLERAREIGFLVLSEALHGIEAADGEVDPDAPGKPEGEASGDSGPSPMAGSTSPPSTEASPPKASRRPRSKASRRKT